MAKETTDTPALPTANVSASATDYNRHLPADTRAQYEVVDWSGSISKNFGTFGDVHLATLTPAQAARLVRQGFTKLRKK